MIINKLELTSFGKFQNKVLSFEEGFNILQGDNEVGKTTIHKFIEGMLFGFLDPTKSRRSYTNDFQRYQPKNAPDYRGSMTFTIDETRYRIDRNFDKKQSDVALYNDQNGENITNTLSVHQSTKLPDISEFIGISYKLYLNTISTSQLLRNTEKDLGKALIERLHNITTTKDASISIQEIKEDLDKSIAEIGSEKAKTKPYAKAIMQVEELKEQMKISTKKYEESERLFKEKNHKQKEVLETQNLLSMLDQDIAQYENTKKKEQYLKAKQIQTILDQNNLKIDANKELLHLKEEDYDQLLHIKSELQYEQEKKADLLQKSQDLKNNIDQKDQLLAKQRAFSNYQQSVYQFRDLFYARKNTAEDLKMLNDKRTQLSKNIDAITINENLINDHEIVERLKEEKDSLEVSSLEQNVYRLHQEYQQLEQHKFSIVMTILYYVLYVFVIGFFLQKNRKQQIKLHEERKILAERNLKEAEKTLHDEQHKLTEINTKIEQTLAKYDVHQMFELSNLRRQEDQKQQALHTAIKERTDIENQLNKLEKQFQNEQEEFTKQCALLNISEFTSKEELDQFEERYKKHQQIKLQKEQIEETLHITNQQIKQISKTIDELEQTYHQLLQQNKVDTIEAFKAGLKTKQELIQLTKENEQLLSRMRDLTSGQKIEDFKKDINFDLADFQGKKTIRELEEEQTELRKKLRVLESDTYELEKDISIIEKTYTDVYTLGAMLKKAEIELLKIQKEKEALELANQIIDELSKEIQYEFAPSLNDAISQVMDSITDGKYHELKIDPDTNIKIVDDYLKQLLITDDFSTGTIDQIYFSMRLGLSKILFENNFPYILDDTFVNYDASRLSHVLHLLAKEKRQILLFTCHKREHQIALEEKILHNQVHLT